MSPSLRIYFYGVQGSGSTFPSKREQAAYHQARDYAMLEQVFQDLEGGWKKHRQGSFEDFLGGPLSQEAILAYRSRLELPSPRVYGGLTTCVRIETSEGSDIVIDCGSGFRPCATDLQTKWGDREDRVLHVLGSHSHYDHTEGFDQAAVCFDPRNTIRLYGNLQFLRSLDVYLGIFSRAIPEELRRVKTPLTYRDMPAAFHAVELRSSTDEVSESDAVPGDVWELGSTFTIGSTRITAFPTYHSAPCLAYKLEHDGKSFVFCTDHELRRGPDPDHPRQQESARAEAALREHCRGADVVYRDGQFLRSEYDGIVGIGRSKPLPRLDWGHSCIEDVQEMAADCGVGATYVGHHDPNRGWAERNELDNMLALFREEKGVPIELARAETVIEL